MSTGSATSSSTAGDFSDLFTETTKRRESSPIRALIRFANVPGMISLGGGMPHPSTFPFSKMTMQTTTGKELTLEGSDLVGALQYSQTEGHPSLRKFLFDLQLQEHGVTATGPERTHDVTVTTGSQDGLTRVFEMLLSPEDTVLVDEAAYSGALSFLQPLNCGLAPIQTDSGGIIPESLENLLDQWPQDGSKGKRPRVLYMVPCGGNPTGTSLSEERKRRIYEIASRPENNLVLLEDDPYYYIQFNDNDGDDHDRDHDHDGAAGAARTPSFLSMDTDQRVVRFDSFSKVLSAGIRVGFTTAPLAISERLQLHIQSTILHSCALSQVVVASLLHEWGYERFIQHTLEVTKFYRAQRDAFVEAADRHLKPLGEGKVTWTTPTAGMFVWIDLSGPCNACCSSGATLCL